MNEKNKIYDDKMTKTINNLDGELATIRAGRANPHVLDKLAVDYYGTPTPIQQVANVSVPEARMIQIQPWEKSMLKAIEKAILTSDIGINPTNDGTSIRLVFPELTEDRRKELAKDVKKKGEEAKVAVRNVRRDGNVAFKQDIGNVSLTVRGNFTYSNNKILAADEANSAYPYIRDTGYRVNQAKGLIALGLFKDYDDIRNSPQQTEWGTVMPGDIKYKDVNSDGVINDSDRVPIGSTTRPNLIYGFGMSATWKGFDVNLHFQGAGKSSFFIDGFGVRPFSGGDWGNILTDVVGNYWSLGTNENPDAKYPRLTWQNNSNNNRESTYWLRDGSYLRLKTVEVGYTLPKNISRAILMNNVRIFFIGTNLLTFSKFKLWDPEMGSSNGQQYPLSKILTLGLTVNI